MGEAVYERFANLVQAKNISVVHFLIVFAKMLGVVFGHCSVHIPLNVVDCVIVEDIGHYVDNVLNDVVASKVEDKLVTTGGWLDAGNVDCPIGVSAV